MAENSGISWTTHTFNPWMGCTKVSAGCKSCYAENLMDTRYGKVQWGANGTRVKTTDSYWRKPLIKWNIESERAGTRLRVFCASLADVFEDWGGPIQNSSGAFIYKPCPLHGTVGHEDCCDIHVTMDDVRRDLFKLIDATPNLDWLLLTKRPENVRPMWPYEDAGLKPIFPGDPGDLGKPVPCVVHKRRENVWLGTSIESQDERDRWDMLAKCRHLCPVLWVSAEPLLGPIDVNTLEFKGVRPDWIVFGGESDQGAPARPCDIDWIRNGVEQCRDLGVIPFVKQLGSKSGMALKEKAGANPDEWPEDVRIREFPEVVKC